MNDQEIAWPEQGFQAFIRGLPWVILIPVCAFCSWFLCRQFLQGLMAPDEAAMASIGVSTMGAYVVTLFGLTEHWPLAAITHKWGRGILMIIISLVLAGLFFIIIHNGFNVSLKSWAFPIIANSWLVLAATSFVGGDFHLGHIPPVRRMVLNLIISVGFTLLLMRTIVIFPATWFPFLQVTIVTGGLGYLFRKVKQPTFSVLVWALLMLLMFLFVGCAQLLGCYTLSGPVPQFWIFNLGHSTTPAFDVFFAFCCGMNFAVFACLQCWPFRLIRQPFGTCASLLCMLFWNWLLTLAAIPFITGICTGDGGMLETQVFAWHTVFWGFAWVYCFGIGQSPYLWRGQKTPGTWDDVD